MIRRTSVTAMGRPRPGSGAQQRGGRLRVAGGEPVVERLQAEPDAGQRRAEPVVQVASNPSPVLLPVQHEPLSALLQGGGQGRRPHGDRRLPDQNGGATIVTECVLPVRGSPCRRPAASRLGLIVPPSYWLNVNWLRPWEDPLTFTLALVIVVATMIFTPRVNERSGEGWNGRREAIADGHTEAVTANTRKLATNGALAIALCAVFVGGLVERALAVVDDSVPQVDARAADRPVRRRRRVDAGVRIDCQGVGRQHPVPREQRPG